MPQTDRDKSLVEWLATRIMGWHREAPGSPCPMSEHWFEFEDGEECLAAYPEWNPLIPGAATWEVWEKAREMGHIVRLHGFLDEWVAVCSDAGVTVYSDSGPRAICEAVALLTGWKESQEEEDAH